MQTFFSQFGPVEKIETFTDKETGRKKGFAFVTFGDFDSADKCYCEFEVKTITSAMKNYFRKLSEPLMTFRLHQKLITAASK